MPIKVSAKKRVKISARRKLENIARTRAYKNAIKVFLQATSSKDPKSGQKLSRAIAMIDKAAKTHIIHKNKAARLKSRIMKLAAEKKITPVSAKEKIEAPKKKVDSSKPKKTESKAKTKIEKKTDKPAKK